jgi:hypothetical protein
MSTPYWTIERAFKAGFNAGFAVTGEGWNQEYPFSTQDPSDQSREKERADDLERYIHERQAAWEQFQRDLKAGKTPETDQ